MGASPPAVTGVLGDSDALLWTIGRDPVLRSTIVAVATLDRPPVWAQLEDRVASLVARVPPLHSRVAGTGPLPGRLRWVDDPDFDLSHHLYRLALAGPGTRRDVLDLAERMAVPAFDPSLPPWEAVVVEGLEGGRAALVVKVHHAVVDGLGGMALVGELLDEHVAGADPADPARTAAPADPARTAAPADPAAPAAPADTAAPAPAPSGARCPVGALGPVVAGCRRVAGAALEAATHPASPVRRLAGSALSGARLVAPAPVPMAPALRGRGVHRRFEVLDPPYRDLQAAARAAGGTVNDAFVAAVVGGVARYLAEVGGSVPAVRMLMPVSVRHPGDPAAGNRFVPVRFVVPMGVADPVARVRRVATLAGGWKHAPGLGLSGLLAGLLDRLPAPVATAAFGSMLKGTDFVATNVPGPPGPSHLAGAPVRAVYAFAPTSGAAVNVALVTTDGRACVGVAADTAAVAHPDLLVSSLARGFAELAG